MQNGGHLQYFENRGTKYLSETISALGTLGAVCQQKVLREAADLFFSHERSPIQSAEEYCAVALEGEFEELDSRFHDCSPSIVKCLEAHLAAHQSYFVLIV